MSFSSISHPQQQLQLATYGDFVKEGANGGMEVVSHRAVLCYLDMMRNEQSNLEMQVYGIREMQFLADLPSGWCATSTIVTTAGGVDVIAKAMNTYASDVKIQKGGCRLLQKIAATRRGVTAVLVTDGLVDAVERAVLKHLLDDALQLLKLLRSAAKQLGEEKAQEAQEQSTKNAKEPTKAEPKPEQHRRKRKTQMPQAQRAAKKQNVRSALLPLRAGKSQSPSSTDA